LGKRIVDGNERGKVGPEKGWRRVMMEDGLEELKRKPKHAIRRHEHDSSVLI